VKQKAIAAKNARERKMQ
jgi:CRP-like cAMP-binding protein